MYVCVYITEEKLDAKLHVICHLCGEYRKLRSKLCAFT